MNKLSDNVQKLYVTFKNFFGGFLICYFGFGAFLSVVIVTAGGSGPKVGPFDGDLGLILYIMKIWGYLLLMALLTMNVPYEIIKGWIKNVKFKKIIDIFELIFFVFVMGYMITKIINLWASL